MTIQFDEDKQNQKIDFLRKKEAEELAQALSVRYGIEYIDLTAVPIDTDGLLLIPEKDSREAKAAIFDLIGKQVKVAMLSPENEKAQVVLKSLETQGYVITPYLTSTASLEKAWNSYKDLSYATSTKAGSLEISDESIAILIKEIHSVNDVKIKIVEILKEKKSYRITRIMEVLLAGSLTLGASDIHIEPEESYVRIRYRLDGVLVDLLEFDHETYALMLSRVKLLSGLKLNVKRDAQDGRFSVKLPDGDIEIRTSILPGAYAESIVLRVLNPKSIAVPLEDMGIRQNLFDILQKEIAKPNGLILTTGPTGSGKTTTLYAFLRKIYNPTIKIITIEDPIEYHLPGIVQTQTDSEKGYTFLSGLRAALRQDPDVIMVGEIRDHETAEIAVNSALTGHLVFSTLHTNNAGGAFPRLIDLGVNPKVITSAINIAMAQRLIRKLCVVCKKEVLLEGDNKILVDKVVASLPSDEKASQVTKTWVSVGCPACNNTGYKGRIGVYEAIKTDRAVEAVIQNNPSEREIKKAASPQGILDLRQDGILKVLDGLTSIDELGRVVDLTEEL